MVLESNSKAVKGQGAVEFMMIFIFVFALIGILIGVVGYYSKDISQMQQQKEIDAVIESISTEVKIYVDANRGYYRRFEIPDVVQKRFNISVNQSFLILQDLEFEGPEGEKYYYDIFGNVTVNLLLENVAGVDKYYLVFNKSQ